MEMRYDGTLALPSSYVQMNDDEMTYTSGGLDVETWIVGAAIDVGLSAIGVWNESAIGWLMGQGISKLCSNITKVVGGKYIGNILKSNVLQTGLGSYITSKIGIFGTVLGMTSLGGMIATVWDMWDGSIDNTVKIF